MGSGHFLVHTVDFISDRIIAFLADYPENPVIQKIANLKKEILEEIKRQGVRIDESKLTEVNLIKRMVMKRCIYGVDLNDMAVELAKLSLWLDSFTLGAPLSFLDHHLKCGNSLIGIFDISDVVLPGSEAYGKVQRALSFMLQVSELTDATISEARKSYDLFKHARQEIEPIRRRFDVATARHFTDLGTTFGRVEQLAYTLDYDNEPYPEIIEKCKFALSVAEEKRFFHWQIEFPEVFYSEKGEKENPGFDCVIGNPPYDVLSELEQERVVEPEKEFYKNNRVYSSTIGGKINYYRLFSILSLHLLRKYGAHSFIVPMALLADKQARALRELMLRKYCLQRIEAFPQKDNPKDRVFEEAKLSTCIYILKTTEPCTLTLRIHSGKDISESSSSLNIKLEQLEEIDKDNLSIPSYPNMTTKDFVLSLNLIKISKGVALKEFASSQQGEVNLTEHTNFFISPDNGKIVLRGAHINRYEFQDKPKQGTPIYLDVDKFLKVHGKETKAYDYQYKRIGYQRGSAIDNWRRIISTTIEPNNFCSDTINYIVTPKKYNLFAILALLNSSLWEWRFRLTSTNNHVNSYEIDSMPMPPVSFSTPEQKRKERVAEAIRLYQSESGYIVINADKWQNKEKVSKDEQNKDKKGSAKSRKVAKKPHGYNRAKKGISGKGSGLGGEVDGIRERTGEYGPPEGTDREGKDSTRPVDSTRYFETAQGTLSYSAVNEILAVSVTKSIEAVITLTPDEIHFTPEWICKLHDDIAGSLFPEWAGRFRDVNVVVGTHTPPPYFEVPIHVRQYCDDLAARLSFAAKEQKIETFAETLAFADWRFQWIHPFRDFNGRAGRILLSAVLFKLKLPPAETAEVEPEEKEKYLSSLRAADNGDLSMLSEIWLGKLSKAMSEKEGK
jgi:Alw26I/Eco31I/Esp3I family type II restriction m6 adenine DNA methyltransferase